MTLAMVVVFMVMVSVLVICMFMLVMQLFTVVLVMLSATIQSHFHRAKPARQQTSLPRPMSRRVCKRIASFQSLALTRTSTISNRSKACPPATKALIARNACVGVKRWSPALESGSRRGSRCGASSNVRLEAPVIMLA
mmetsp:Transcript_28751/g.51217  ORF Transcript_28751/g.51217 Transcript_28751/m.51217 type:complete len:138 (-) Transcript_28751:100-513(-)